MGFGTIVGENRSIKKLVDVVNERVPEGGKFGQVLHINSDSKPEWVTSRENLTGVTFTDNGNTVTYTYNDGTCEIMRTVSSSTKTITRYDEMMNPIEVITITTSSDGNITISRE